MQPDEGKWKFLAASLLYTENTDGEDTEPMLTVRQVAALLGLCAATVYEHRTNGNLRHARIGWAIRVARSDLEQFIEERSVPRRFARQGPQALLPPRRADEVGPLRSDDVGGECRAAEFPTHETLPGERGSPDEA